MLREGAAGQAKFVLKGKGNRLREVSPFDSLMNGPLVLPLTVQLVSTTGVCWQSVYDSGVTQNDGTKFVAKPD